MSFCRARSRGVFSTLGSARQMSSFLFRFSLFVGSMLFAYSANAEQASRDMLLIANTGEPLTLDPHRYNLRLEETLLNDLFMGLTTFNAAGEIVPGAAARWEASEDGMVWTFYLKPELRWSDGTPLTADDFVFAFRRLQNPETAASLAYFMNMLANAEAINSGQMPPEKLGVRAIDSTTLRLTLQRPYPFLLERLLYPTAFPVPRHAIEKHGDDWVKAEHWVSNGAYTLQAWVPQAYIELQANPLFIEPVSIQQARYLPVASEQAAYNRYRNGELHVIPSFPVGELNALRDNPDLRLSSLLSMFYLVFNTREAPFDDVRVRQALSLAVNQEILTDKVMRSGNQPEYTFAPSAIADYTGNSLPHRDLPPKERISRAKTLLQLAGFGPDNPLQLTLRHPAGLEIKKVNLAIGGMWKAIGVQASLQQADLRSHFADLRSGSFQVGWAGWIGENNAEHYLGLLKSDIGNVNYGGFANPVFDALFRQAQQQSDATERNALLASAEEVATHLYPVVPLYSSTVRRLVTPRLQGWKENGRDMHQLRYLSWSEE